MRVEDDRSEALRLLARQLRRWIFCDPGRLVVTMTPVQNAPAVVMALFPVTPPSFRPHVGPPNVDDVVRKVYLECRQAIRGRQRLYVYAHGDGDFEDFLDFCRAGDGPR